MRRSRKLGIALVITVVASATLGGAIGSSAAAAGGHRSSGRVIYRGKSAPLRQLAARDRAIAAARPTRSAGGLNGRVEANLAHIDQVNAIEQESGSDPEPFPAPKVAALPQDLSAPGVIASWEGANSYANDWSFNGNQFSVEPPDQGLCAGNGFVFETVNQVIQIYDHSGTPLLYGPRLRFS